MTENLSKDGVQSRQAVFVRCCLNYSLFAIRILIKPPSVSKGAFLEARRIELLSGKYLQRVSPSAAYYLRFPRRSASMQALRFGRLRVMIQAEPLLYSRSPLIDARYRPWYSCNERLPN